MAKNIVLAVVALMVVAGGVFYWVHTGGSPISTIEEGIPIYPGSSTDADSFAARLSPRDKAKYVKAVTYRTDDPPSKVIEFYRNKLTGKTQVLEAARHGVASAVIHTEVSGKSKYILVDSNEDTNKTEIIISIVSPQK